MSAKREKRIRQALYWQYIDLLREWYRCEPPKWRIISHLLWRLDKPSEPKKVVTK